MSADRDNRRVPGEREPRDDARHALRAAAGELDHAQRPAPIRAFLCDDAPELRSLLRSVLEWEGGVEVVGEAGDGHELAAAVAAVRAEVVLLDLSMPRVDGLEALADLRAADTELAIIVLSGFESARMEAQTLELGADRYVEKRASLTEVRAVLHSVVAERRGSPPPEEAA